MNLIFTIILGAVQGITEFLPISSSGHLILFRNFLNFEVLKSTNVPYIIKNNHSFE
jgi:undecaprenyl pyrophosphate phosphatase UppP